MAIIGISLEKSRVFRGRKTEGAKTQRSKEKEKDFFIG